MSEIDWARKLFRSNREDSSGSNTSLSQNGFNPTNVNNTSVRTGTVEKINEDGTIDVRLDGSNTVIKVKSETPVEIGDRIKIIKQGQTWVVYAMKTYVNQTQKKIDDLHNEIDTKGAEIEESVKKDVDKVQKDLDSFKETHKMTDDDITTSITSNNNELNAKIEGVQSDLTENYAKKTEVSASIDGLRTEVSENYVNSSTLGEETSKLQSQITQNATAISTEVSDRKTAVSGAVSDSKAYTDQKADSISSTVEQNVMNAVGETYATKSEVKQTSDGLEVKITSAVGTANDAKTAADSAADDASTALTTANSAKTAASKAAKTATDYLKYSSSGLEIGNANLDANVLINSTSVNVRNGSQNLASFESGGVNFYNSSGTNIASITALSGISEYAGGSDNTVRITGQSGLILNNFGSPTVLYNQNNPFPLTANSTIGSNITYLAGGVCLYANTSGSNGSINLKLSTSRNVSNYKWMDIFFKEGASGTRNFCQRVSNPASGKGFSLFRIVHNNDGTYYVAVNMYTWTARGMTIGAAGQGYFNTSNQCGQAGDGGQLYITQVIGWR